jgi:hypothetical protein
MAKKRLRLRMPKIKKTFSMAQGRTFTSGGWGRYGPYVSVSRRVGKRTWVKASTGTRGSMVDIKHRFGKRVSASVGYNIITQKPSVKVSYRKKR